MSTKNSVAFISSFHSNDETFLTSYTDLNLANYYLYYFITFAHQYVHCQKYCV